jgi:pyrroline-5-carboxylate reductase
MNSKQKIVIIGAGTLGQAIARGLVSSGEYTPDQITLTKRIPEFSDELQKEGFHLTFDNKKAVQSAEVCIICVRPNQMDDVLEEIKEKIRSHQIIISTVTGYSLNDIQQKWGSKAVFVRAMPNTAVSIRESMTCLAASPNVEGKKLKKIRAIFDLLGDCVVIQEELMAAATALCACGIAFFLRAIRAASQGGVEVGFHAEEAILMAAQTARGAASLVLNRKTHPETEVDKVTTPEGCTIVGLNKMEHHGFSSALIQGIVLSTEKARQLLNKK